MSCIWPVSDTDAEVELVVIPDYHRSQPRGFIAVQAACYSARWEHDRPGFLAVRSADGESNDWLEWSFHGDLLDADECSIPGAVLSDWAPSPSLEGSQSYRGDSVEAEWIQRRERGLLRARLVFLPDAIRYSLTFHATNGNETRVPERYASVRLGNGTHVHARAVFDYKPDTSGTFLRPLHAMRTHAAKWLTPPPFALAFHQLAGDWSILAVECPAEALEFTTFSGNTEAGGTMGFRLDYQSLPEFSNDFTSPELVWRFGFADQFAALQAHVDGLVQMGLAEAIHRDPPEWHKRPMCCGWHRQVELATALKNPGSTPDHLAQAGFATGAARAQDFSRQDVYEDHLACYERAGIDVGTVVIDHGWSVTEGDWRPDLEKWPDLAGFVQAQHAKNRRVLLWICVMSNGLPEEELVRNLEGPHPFALDPRHPKWKRRVENCLRGLLGSDGIHADGLKLDFTGPNSNPSRWQGEGDVLHGYTYLWEFFRTVSTAALAVRPDALLDFQCAHPQFAGFHTMTRLNDFFLSQAQAVRVMSTRARIAKIAALGALIDTDCPAGLAYLRSSSNFGNQSLYLTNAQLADPEVVAAVKAGQAGKG